MSEPRMVHNGTTRRPVSTPLARWTASRSRRSGSDERIPVTSAAVEVRNGWRSATGCFCAAAALPRLGRRCSYRFGWLQTQRVARRCRAVSTSSRGISWRGSATLALLAKACTPPSGHVWLGSIAHCRASRIVMQPASCCPRNARTPQQAFGLDPAVPEAGRVARHLWMSVRRS